MNGEEYRGRVDTVSYNRRKSVNTATRQDMSTAGDSDKEDDQVSEQPQTKLCGPLEVKQGYPSTSSYGILYLDFWYTKPKAAFAVILIPILR